jgi:hypothetical protein
MTTPGEGNQTAGQATATAPDRPASTDSGQTSVEQMLDAGAVRAFHQAFMAVATRSEFDPEDVARQLVRDGRVTDMTWTMLRALEAEARTGEVAANERWDSSGITAIADHLRAVAGHLAPPSAEVAAAQVSAASEDADFVFKVLDSQGVGSIGTGADPVPPPELFGRFPIQLGADDVQNRFSLRQRVQDRITDGDPRGIMLPFEDSTDLALGIVDEVCRNTVETGPTAREMALLSVQIDRVPLQTAMRLRQFAELLNTHVPDPADQRQRFGTYPGGRSLAQHLRAIDTEIMAVAAVPANLIRARVDGLFAPINTTLGLPRTLTPDAAPAREPLVSSTTANRPARSRSATVPTVDEEQQARVLQTELSSPPTVNAGTPGSAESVVPGLRDHQQMQRQATDVARGIIDRVVPLHQPGGSAAQPVASDKAPYDLCVDAGRPWGFDIAVTELLTTHADELRTQAAGSREQLNGLDRDGLITAAQELEVVVERVGRDRGFTPRSASEIRSDIPKRPGEATRADDDSSAWLDDPSLVPAEALLGSAIHSPDTLGDLAKFLRADDFPRSGLAPFTRSVLGEVYQTLQGLYKDRQLQDCSTLATDSERMAAAHANHLRVVRALREAEYIPVGFTNPAKVVARLTEAAPPEAIGFGRLHDPSAQVRMGLMVLKDSIPQRVIKAGGSVRRATTGLLARLNPARSANHAAAVLANLTDVAQRLAIAGDSGGADAGQDELTALLASHRNEGLPPVPRMARPFVRRSEALLLTAALRGNASVLKFSPEDFSVREHATAWSAIKALQEAGHPINYVTVFHQIRELPEPHRSHGPSALALKQLEQRPNPTPSQLVRALRTVSHSTLQRAAAQAAALTAEATNIAALPSRELVGLAVREHTALARQAKVVADLHKPQQQRSPGRSA